MNGMLMVGNNVIRPPFQIRQVADRLFINDVQVYPPPEVTPVPQVETLGWEDVFAPTERAGAVERMSEAEGKVNAFFESKSDTWSAFRQASFDGQADEVVSFLEGQGVKTERSPEFGDVLVPVTEDYGVIALFNEDARLDTMRELEERHKPETVFEYDAVKNLAESVEACLAQGHFIRFGENHLVAAPREQVEVLQQRAREATWGEGQGGFDELTYEQRVAAIADSVSGARTAVPLANPPCSAVIFFPHRSWQKEVVGRASTYWAELQYKLLAEGYKVCVYLDTAVSLPLWATVLKNGKSRNLRVIYNLGHGSGDLIQVGTPRLKSGWHYFRSSFVNKYANLSNTVAFIHSCSTMSNTKMAKAFVDKGACAYLGWRVPTSAGATYCDKVDALFWEPMIDLHSTAIYAKKNVATVDKDLLGYGCRYCRTPIREWKC